MALSDTYVDQSKVVFVNGKLLWTNVFLQSRGIGALKWQKERRKKVKYLLIILNIHSHLEFWKHSQL